MFDWGDRLPTLPAERVQLRWLRPEDAAALFSIFGDAEVMRYWSSPPMGGLVAARALVTGTHDSFLERTMFHWGIATRTNDRVIGTCTLFHLDAAHRRGEVGFALGRESWGQGLMTEALSTLIGFAFHRLDLYRLEADTDPRNARSLRVLEHQGFKREGLLRGRYHVGGEIQDSVYLGLLRNEWVR